jgi:hypothetical protein
VAEPVLKAGIQSRLRVFIGGSNEYKVLATLDKVRIRLYRSGQDLSS